MPKLDGFEVVRLLREDAETRALPIVMLTERTSEDDVLDGLDLGVEEYMPKPFSPRELSRRVQRALARAADICSWKLDGVGCGPPRLTFQQRPPQQRPDGSSRASRGA